MQLTGALNWICNARQCASKVGSFGFTAEVFRIQLF